MIIGTTLYFGSLLLVRTKAEVINREKHSRWAKKMLLGNQL
jgi:hypothetical protein